jgi:hypothetical protein
MIILHILHIKEVLYLEHNKNKYLRWILSLDLLLWFNLDDDNEIAKIYEEVQNELNLLFSSSMSLNDNNHDDPPKKSDSPYVEHGDAPITTLDVVPWASYSPSTHTK